jgi:hypothetical protein
MIYKHEFEIRKKEVDLQDVLEGENLKKKDIVRFSLFCAKDCFKFNNYHTKRDSIRCISAAHRWLVRGTKIPPPPPVDHESTPSIGISAYYANESAKDIVAGIITNSVYELYMSAWHAANAFAYNESGELHEKTHDDKVAQYTSYALSLLRTSNKRPSCRGSIPDKITLMALLDELGELGETVILRKNGFFKLNVPPPVHIRAETMDQLVDLIWNYKPAVHYLEKLYEK